MLLRGVTQKLETGEQKGEQKNIHTKFSTFSTQVQVGVHSSPAYNRMEDTDCQMPRFVPAAVGRKLASAFCLHVLTVT
jgi:hypothetical protein